MRSRKVSMAKASVADQLHQQLYATLQNTGGNPSHLLDLLYIAVESRVWEKQEKTFTDYITASYADGGLSWSIDNLRAITRMTHHYELKDAETAERMKWLRSAIEDLLSPQANRQGIKKNNRPKDKPDHVRTSKSAYGNSRLHMIARLKRDNPKLSKSRFLRKRV